MTKEIIKEIHHYHYIPYPIYQPGSYYPTYPYKPYEPIGVYQPSITTGGTSTNSTQPIKGDITAKNGNGGIISNGRTNYLY